MLSGMTVRKPLLEFGGLNACSHSPLRIRTPASKDDELESVGKGVHGCRLPPSESTALTGLQAAPSCAPGWVLPSLSPSEQGSLICLTRYHRQDGQFHFNGIFQSQHLCMRKNNLLYLSVVFLSKTAHGSCYPLLHVTPCKCQSLSVGSKEGFGDNTDSTDR